ncbi:13690_t:CDS:2 [Ambispora gerdemannii]|uniref:13690_t:CDS:1 n=1 Tax=Ambispora gerdemannii TaxID=144530 RepID=A0A9N9FV56_9GLOM|nr:13690_t:CDS:2 [Ambispora gerdemannii]
MQQLPIDDRLTAEFVNIDDHMPITAIPTPEEILTSLREPEEDDEELPMKLSLSEAKVSLEKFGTFFGQSTQWYKWQVEANIALISLAKPHAIKAYPLG